MSINLAQAHLVLIHFPVALCVFGTIFLVLEALLKRPALGMIARSALVGAAVTGIGAFLTGEGAEDVLKATFVQELPSSPASLRSWIHEHEEMAEKAFALIEATGALSLLALIFDRSPRLKHWVRPVRAFTLLFAVLACGFLANAAHLGGMIRHTEIRPTTSSSLEAPGANSDESREQDE